MRKAVKVLIQVILLLFPWSIRRMLLNAIFGFKIHKTARIQLSIILTKRLEMDENTRIRNFSFCNGIDFIKMQEHSKIGTFIYITGFPTDSTAYFSHVKDRKCELILGKHSAITSRHFIDCTAGLQVGSFTTIAGIRSQILTHSIDLINNRQNAKRIEIGKYCFLGTNCVILPGAVLPDYSILGAKSLLNKVFVDGASLYGGVPALKIRDLDRSDIAYFRRDIGSVK